MKKVTGKSGRVGRRGMAAVCEAVEGRRMMSVSLVNGVVTAAAEAGAYGYKVDVYQDSSYVTVIEAPGTSQQVMTSFPVGSVTGVQVSSTGITYPSARSTLITYGLTLPLTYIGGVAMDDVTAGSGADVLYGGGGDDTLMGYDGADLLVGGDGDDILNGGNGTDTLQGGAGQDRFYNGAALDLFAVRGADVVDYSERSTPVAVNLGNLVVEVLGLSVLPAVNGGAAGNEDLYYANFYGVIGGAGNDTLTGGPGNDVVAGGGGADVMAGGGGIDTADYSRSAVGVNVSLDGVANDGAAGEGDSVASDFEVILGGSGQDLLDARWSTTAVRIEGGGARDVIRGGAGSDTLIGGDGNDLIYGLGGSDWVDGGNGTDVINVYGDSTADTVVTSAGNDVANTDSGTTDTIGAGIVRRYGPAAGIFRGGTGAGYFQMDADGNWAAGTGDWGVAFGNGTDVPVVGDWNGSGVPKIGTFRVTGGIGQFCLDYNGNGTWDGTGVDRVYNFGGGGDKPVVGDWNNDGVTDIGIARPVTTGSGAQVLQFWLDANGSTAWDGADLIMNFGNSTDTPIAGDWNGDGRTDVGVVRATGSLLWVRDANGDRVVNDTSFSFGNGTDKPIVGDWNGDGMADLGIFRNVNGVGYWYLDRNGDFAPTAGDFAFYYGLATDTPVVF